MHETDLANPEVENSVEDRKSCPPDFYLAVLLHELRTPVMTIKGWARILSNESAKELHPKALEDILYSIENLEDLGKGITDYYQELTRKT